MPEIKVITISAEQAEHGVAELWADGQQIAYTVLDDGELKLRFPPATTAPRWWSACAAWPRPLPRSTAS